MLRFLTEYFTAQPREVPADVVYVNGWAVLAAALAALAVGAAWFSPPLLGRAWLRLRCAGPEGARGRLLAAALVASGALLSASVMAYLFGILGPDRLAEGLMAAALLWLGFAVPVLLLDAGLERRPLPAVLVKAGGLLAAMLAMGAVLSPWS